MAFMFPWSNFHELNLDWILSVVKEATDIFKNGEADIQNALETSEQALETAEQAAQGVIADGSVSITKMNDDVLKMFAYVVSGRVNELPIPKDSFVIVRLSTIPSISDGLYQAARNIPANSMLTDLDLKQPAELGDGTNNVLQQICNAIESGLLNIVDGDTATYAVPAGSLAFIKNNEHGLSTGFYTNSSSTTFPTTGGIADSSTFTRVSDVLNTLNGFISNLNAITGNGALSGFTASDLTGAANELKTILNSVIPVITGSTNNSGYPISAGDYFIANGVLYTATAAIPQNSAWSTSAQAESGNGGLNDLQNGQTTLFGSGLVMTGDQNFTAYGNYTVTLYPNHTMKADIACKVETSVGLAANYGGVDKTIFETLTGKTITPVSGGTALFFDENRALMADNGYGGTWRNGSETNHPELWIPARTYDITGSVGTWALNHWQVGKFFYGTVIGTWA